jgi:hypothetical protein
MDQGVIASFKICYPRTFAQAVEGTVSGLTSRELWKSFKICQAVSNTAKAWKEVGKVCMNVVWK